jgi:Fic/DOC family protein
MELAGREVPIVWHGRRAKAFVPTLLSDRHLTLDFQAGQATAAAAAEVGFAASALEADDEPLARLLLRAEGVASSYIEGVRAPVADVVMAEEMPTSDTAAAWVAANLAALIAAVAQAMTGELSVDQLCEWHRTLMTGSPTPARYVGVIRDEQGWIGGTDPTNAALVTPPPDMLGPLLQDLVAYINRTDVDPIAQAAIAHVQFEIVHPFADGNGRIGRLLVSWILTRRLHLVVPPPVSVAMAADVGGYLSGLTLFRIGDHNEWVRWFAGATGQGSRAQTGLIRAVDELKSRWRVQLADRALRRGAGAWRVLDLLPRHLMLTSHVVAQECGLSAKGAIDALKTLASAGVLTDYGVRPAGPGRPRHIFVNQDLLALTGSSPLR